MLIDLQLHSTYSDGYLTPTELAKYISKQGIKVAALTDHNTVSGLPEFCKACQRLNIKPIVGLELYVKMGNKKLNILWYNFDINSPELHDLLRDSQSRRRIIFRNTLLRLKRRGFIINVDKILDKYHHYIPLNHVIDDILAVRKNCLKIKRELKIKEIREEDVISNYLQNPRVGRLVNSYININKISKLKKKLGGKIILCHPAKYGHVKKDLWPQFKKLGVDGVELLSPHHSYGSIASIQHSIREFGFITTGGSDFHRLEKGKVLVKESWKYFRIDSKMLSGVKDIIG